VSAPLFTPEQAARMEQIASSYPDRASALLPLLHACQEAKGRLTEDALIYAADLAGVPHVRAFEVATYHTLFFTTRQRGRHLVQACRNLTCSLHGCDLVFDAVRRELGVDRGQITPDGLFSLITAECLGACDHAPALLVDDDLFTDVTPEAVPAIIARFRREAAP
jgi:NADH:ubiquinone oxidoreductase subunit E